MTIIDLNYITSKYDVVSEQELLYTVTDTADSPAEYIAANGQVRMQALSSS